MDITRKSVDYYTFLGGEEFTSFYRVPDDHGKKTRGEDFRWEKAMPLQSGGTDMSNEDLHLFEKSGRFRWEAHQKRGTQDVTLGSAYWEISPVTGSMQVDKYPDSPTDMLSQTSRTSAKDNWACSYGFYDSGAGFGELTNHDQSYVYVTRDVSNWMGDLVKRAPRYADAPFRSFVLPGSHDAGMYDKALLKQIAHNAAFLGLLGGLLGMAISKTVEPHAVKIAQNLGMTQKDTASTQLDLGARYFDFRPGTCAPGILASGIYHQHSFIPGIGYDTFLHDLFNWLKTHPSEIAVLCVGFAGFVSDSMKPGQTVLETAVTDARKAAGAESIALMGVGDLGKTYNELVRANGRLFVFYGPDTSATVKAKKYDSYTSAVYETTKVSNIIGALNGMTKSGQAGFDYTVLQLQGTASGFGVGALGTIANASWSGSPLMSTKAAFDRQTYPWVTSNARRNLGDGQLTILLNDYVDNALAIHAMKTMAPELF